MKLREMQQGGSTVLGQDCALVLDSLSPNPCSTTYRCVTFSKFLNFSLLQFHHL